MTKYDVVKKLVGEIDPVGETNTDDKRYENLKEMAELVDRLLFDINSVSGFSDCPEHSRSRAGEFAKKFIYNVKEAY